MLCNISYFIVVGLDYVVKDNRSEVGIPKYNNKVQNPAMFDRDTQVYLPNTMLKEPSMAGKRTTDVDYVFID